MRLRGAFPHSPDSPLMSQLRITALLAVALAVAGAPAALQAQVPVTIEVTSPDAVVEIRLADGSVLFGRVTAVDDSRVTIETTGGTRVDVDRGQIRSIRPVRGTQVAGAFWPADPNGTRLFFGPTARSLQAGQGSFGVFELFFPFASYGVTDRFSISGGTPIVPDAIGEVGYIAPQLQVMRTSRTAVAVGAMAAFGTDDVATAGLLYGVGTFGSADDAITVSAAFPFYTDGDDGDVGSDPLFMIGGENRISRRVKLLTENYFIPGEEGALISGGIRILGDRLTADFGVGAAIGDGGGGCCLPLVNFVYTFGGR
jgi:hypothetical protein